MKTVGIDYSLCSPCVAVTHDGVHYEAHYLTDTKKFLGNWKYGNISVTGWQYPQWHTPEERHHLLSEWSVRLCIDAGRVVIEDYAMGAKGRVFHIGENCGLLKWKLWNLKIGFSVVPPTVLKKFATGKGNSDKEKMHDAFVGQLGVDLRAAMTPTNTKVGNPVSDIVDAIFLCRFTL